MVELIAPHTTLQYSTARDRADTSVAGMWLFLASELLFFGALFLAFIYNRYTHAEGFAIAAAHTNLLIGGVNTAILVSSSLAYALGLLAIEAGSRRGLLIALAVTFSLGVSFLALKGLEWRIDLREGLWPGTGFDTTLLRGADSGGVRLFFCWYWLGTAVHGLHMLVGLGLIAWLARKARRGEFDGGRDPANRGWTMPPEVVGLYWSFVDMMWLILFPMIYLFGRAG